MQTSQGFMKIRPWFLATVVIPNNNTVTSKRRPGYIEISFCTEYESPSEHISNLVGCLETKADPSMVTIEGRRRHGQMAQLIGEYDRKNMTRYDKWLQGRLHNSINRDSEVSS